MYEMTTILDRYQTEMNLIGIIPLVFIMFINYLQEETIYICQELKNLQTEMLF